MEACRRFWGLLDRRECWVPTRRGWVVVMLLGAGLGVLTLRGSYPFLAVTDPIPGGALVVEGWEPDYALAQALAEFKRNPYTKLYVTGGPLEQGAPLSEYKTYAELGAAMLVRMGLSADSVQAVPAARARQDRTYASAVALRRWLRERGLKPTSLTVISLGTHARRSRLLFEKAMGESARVGILAIEDRSYDAQRWWRYSQGVRAVTTEMIAYGYARLLFHPPKTP